MKELSRITWFGLRKDGYKLGRYYDPDEPAATFEVEVAVPGLAAHRVATITINGAEIGRRSNVQAAMSYAEWVLQHRRRGDFRRRLDDSQRPALCSAIRHANAAARYRFCIGSVQRP